MFFSILIDGIQAGGSDFTKPDGANDAVPVQFELPLVLTVGQVITTQLIRGSQGNDSGGLLTEDPTAIGWNDSGSASVTVVKE